MLVLATAHRLLRGVETEEAEDVPEVEDVPGAAAPAVVERPVLVAVDDAPHADEVVAAGARLARTVDAPVVVVHVPEDAVAGDALPVGDDRGVLAGRVEELTAAGVRAVAESLAPVASHDAVGLALVAARPPPGRPRGRRRQPARRSARGARPARAPTRALWSTPTAPSW